MLTGHAERRIGRRGAVGAATLAAAWAACAAPPVQPPATRHSLERLAAAARFDIYGRPAAIGPLLAGRAVLYFFRTDCPHCAADLAVARALAARPDLPAIILVSRESAARLREVLGPTPARLVVLSDSAGALMGTALPTRFVPRVVLVSGYRVLLDQTGEGGAGLGGAAGARGGGP
jgi:hypothetical protein